MVAKKQELVLAENNDPVSGPPAAFSPATGSTLMGLIEFVSDELDQSDCGRTFSLSHVIDNGPDSPMLHRAIGAKLPLEDAKIEAMKLVERYYAEASGHVLNHKLPQRYVFTTYGKDKLPRGTREFTLYPPMASMVGMAQRGIQLPPGMLGDNVEKKKEDVLRKAFLLFDSLRPEQQATWAGCLDPLQVSLLVELGEAVHQFKALMPQKAA